MAPHCRETNVKKLVGTFGLVQENKAIKRQKLDGGKSRLVSRLKLHLHYLFH